MLPDSLPIYGLLHCQPEPRTHLHVTKAVDEEGPSVLNKVCNGAGVNVANPKLDEVVPQIFLGYVQPSCHLQRNVIFQNKRFIVLKLLLLLV